MRSFLILLIFFVSFNTLTAQYNQDSLSAVIERVTREYVDTNKACVVVGVIRKEGSQTIFEKRYSYGHIRHDTLSPRPDSLTIFHIGSSTKSYTATILSMLIQQGGPLALNDLVEDHIPLDTVTAPFFVNSSGDTLRMTILDLASHYSALPDDPIIPVNDSTSYQMMYNYLSTHRLSRPPGKCYLYSNLGVSFLGVVLSNTLGNIIDSLFIQKLCDPLDMPDTRITLTPEQLSRRPTGYLPNGDSASYFKSSWPAFYAAGGLYTTIKDFSKYLKFNMGLSGLGMQNVLDSAHKIRRVNNDTCQNPESKARIGLVWQMELLNPLKDTTQYFVWKDGDVPGFSSYICFNDDESKELKSGVVMISNITIDVDKMAIEILKYMNSTGVSEINQISTAIPERFKLYQNYPNPFNPGTVIRYSLLENRLTSLKVFDALGKEVMTLVDQKQDPGSYEIEFNGNALPSGVYFYKLTSGDFTETRKMFLVK